MASPKSEISNKLAEEIERSKSPITIEVGSHVLVRLRKTESAEYLKLKSFWICGLVLSWEPLEFLVSGVLETFSYSRTLSIKNWTFDPISIRFQMYRPQATFDTFRPSNSDSSSTFRGSQSRYVCFCVFCSLLGVHFRCVRRLPSTKPLYGKEHTVREEIGGGKNHLPPV